MLKRALAVTAVLALAAPAAANAGFKEPVKVLWQHTGAAGQYFGWAVSPLGRRQPRPRHGRDHRRARQRRARRGRGHHLDPLRPRAARPSAASTAGPATRAASRSPTWATSTATAVHDVLSGAPRWTADTEGHAYLISGRDGSLLHTFAGEASGDSFGAAVSGAGDVNRDGRPDLLIGAAEPSGRGHGVRLLRADLPAAVPDRAA